jgi:hypothetical protein
MSKIGDSYGAVYTVLRLFPLLTTTCFLRALLRDLRVCVCVQKNGVDKKKSLFFELLRCCHKILIIIIIHKYN